MKVSTEIDNNFGYEKITQLVDNIPLMNEYLRAISSVFLTAPTNDEVMILLVRRATIKEESLVGRSLC
jgi:hypothetical protein